MPKGMYGSKMSSGSKKASSGYNRDMPGTKKKAMPTAHDKLGGPGNSKSIGSYSKNSSYSKMEY